MPEPPPSVWSWVIRTILPYATDSPAGTVSVRVHSVHAGAKERMLRFPRPCDAP
ncbi:hypothetical protein GCM10010221_03710 [Streptomyces parvus]|nr:hypothetical protein GCM10010221_03710 [Streptomyces parvus]